MFDYDLTHPEYVYSTFWRVSWLLAVIDRKILFGCGTAEKTDEGSGESQGNGIESLKMVCFPLAE